MLRQYRDCQSGFTNWDQRAHAKDWLLYPQHLGPQLSLDETSLSQGELYTILTNKAVQGRSGSIVAIVAGTKAETVIDILRKRPDKQRKKVKEITLDMAGNMGLIAKKCFPKATQIAAEIQISMMFRI